MDFQVKILENGRESIFRHKPNKKQRTGDIFRCKSPYRKVEIAFLDSINKQVQYSVCIQRLKITK